MVTKHVVCQFPRPSLKYLCKGNWKKCLTKKRVFMASWDFWWVTWTGSLEEKVPLCAWVGGLLHLWVCGGMEAGKQHCKNGQFCISICLLCFGTVLTMWTNQYNDAVNVPEFSLLALDRYIGPHSDLREALCMDIVEVLYCFFVLTGLLFNLFHIVWPFFWEWSTVGWECVLYRLTI